MSGRLPTLSLDRSPAAQMRSGRKTGTQGASQEPARRLRSQRALVVALVSLTAGCGSQEPKYEPKQPPTEAKANIPSPPDLPDYPIKDGEAYTVWGASYSLRSRVHRTSVAGRELTIAGYITKTNLDSAPKCAIHPTGKEDPADCRAPIPAFWLGDTPDAAEEDSLKVLGWASNFAQIYDAVRSYRRDRKRRRKRELQDHFWGVPIPNPLPAIGAKAIVSGVYSTTFTRATSGAEADPLMGLLTYSAMEYTEESEELATLPGLRP